MGEVANHVTNTILRVMPLMVGDEVIGLLHVVTNELEARCNHQVRGGNEEGGREEIMMIMVGETRGKWMEERWNCYKRTPTTYGQCSTPWNWSEQMGEAFARWCGWPSMNDNGFMDHLRQRCTL